MLQYSPIHFADQVYLEIDLDPTFEKIKDLDPAWWMSSGFYLNFKPCFYLFYLLFIYLLANDSLGYCFQLKIIQYPLALCCVFGRIWIRFGQDPDSVVECPDPDSTKNPRGSDRIVSKTLTCKMACWKLGFVRILYWNS